MFDDIDFLMENLKMDIAYSNYGAPSISMDSYRNRKMNEIYEFESQALKELQANRAAERAKAQQYQNIFNKQQNDAAAYNGGKAHSWGGTMNAMDAAKQRSQSQQTTQNSNTGNSSIRPVSTNPTPQQSKPVPSYNKIDYKNDTLPVIRDKQTAIAKSNAAQNV